MARKKPSYIPESAWDAYNFYNTLPDLTVADSPVYTAAQKRRMRKEYEGFFEILFFSEQAEFLWRDFPDDKDASDFVTYIKMALVDLRDVSTEMKKSKVLQRQLAPATRKLKGLINQLKNAKYIIGLDIFLTTTNIFFEIESLDTFIQYKAPSSANKWKATDEIDLQSRYVSSVQYALSFRKRQSDKDFCRCLGNLMVPSFGWNPTLRKLLVGALACFFPNPKKPYDEQFIYKTMIPPHSRRKKL